MKRQRLLLVGSRSHIAKKFSSAYCNEYEILAVSRARESIFSLDLESYTYGDFDFSSLGPDYILVLASPCKFSDFVDGAISKPRLYMGSECLLHDLAKCAAPLLYISSSAVFNDNSLVRGESYPTLPATEYGRYKLFCEHLALSFTDYSRVMRITKVLDPEVGVLRGFIDALNQGRSIHPFLNMLVSPVTTAFVVASINDCIRYSGGQRVFHCSGESMISYALIAQDLFEESECIQPCKNLSTHLAFNPIFPQLSSYCDISYIQELSSFLDQLRPLVQDNLRLVPH